MNKTLPSLFAVLLVFSPPVLRAEDREETLERYSRTILPHAAQLTAFLKEMPKGADLHSHSPAAIYPETLIARAMASDPPLLFDLDAAAFAPPESEPANAVSVGEIRSDPRKFREVLDALGARFRRRGGGGKGGLGRLSAAVPPHGAEATEIFTRAIAQKVRHIELTLRPDPPAPEEYPDGEARREAAGVSAGDPRRWRLAHPDPEKRGRAFGRAVEKIISTFETARLARLEALGMDPDAFSARYLVPIDRVLEPALFEEAFVDCIAAWNMCDERLAGFAILGPEDAWESKTHFREQFKIIDRYVRDDANWRDGTRPKFTWRAGELTLDASTYEAMRNRIGETIWMGHADRIGHGVSVAWEDNPYELLRDMRAKGICVEVCPSLNDAVLGVAGNDHPFHLYRAAGVPMAISTGAEGILRSNLTNEYVKAAQEFGLGYKYLKRLSRNSLEYSFLPGESLFEDGDYAARKQSVPAGSVKAAMQARLEADFTEFERYFTERVLKTVLETDFYTDAR